MFSDATKTLGTNMTDQALSEQQAGDHFTPLPDLPDYVNGPTPPTPTPMPQAGTYDSILNTAGTIGNYASLLSKLPYGTTKPTTTPTTPFDPNDETWIGG
jgi:hypothetical protein